MKKTKKEKKRGRQALKICILCEYLSYVGGGERVYCSWANMFAEQLGYDVTIVAMEDWDKPFYRVSPLVKIHSLRLRSAKFYMNSYKRRLDMITSYWHDRYIIGHYLHSTDYDIVIGIALNINLLLSTIKGAFIKIATEHSEYYAPNILLRLIRNSLYNRFNLLTVLNYGDKHLFEKHNSNTQVLTNPVDMLLTVPLQVVLAEKTIVSVGSLSPQKNQRQMLEIMKIVHESHPDWNLKIYGEGPLRRSLEDFIKQHKMSSYVSLEGTTSNIPAVLKSASLFLLTSSIEGFGLVLVEAMSLGIPCISFDTVGPRLIIQDNFNGFLVNKGDIHKFAAKVNQVIADRILRERLGNGAYQSAQQYHPDVVAEKWKCLFQKLVSTHAAHKFNF